MAGNPFSITVHAYDHQGAKPYNESGQAEAAWLAEIGSTHPTRASRPVFLTKATEAQREPRT
jgi:hypothetical protein